MCGNPVAANLWMKMQRLSVSGISDSQFDEFHSEITTV
jgi:hypothetical protein